MTEGSLVEGSLAHHVMAISRRMTENKIIENLVAITRWLSEILDPAKVPVTSTALLEAVDRSPEPVLCLAVTATHPGKVVVLHGLGVFLTPPFAIRDEHTGKILGMVNDVIAGRPPTVIHIGPVAATTPDILFEPRAQRVPTLASLQNHFVATPDALFDADIAPPRRRCSRV